MPESQKTEQNALTRAKLKTPRAAAVAGIVFALLLIAVFVLLRASIPADPLEPGSWLNQSGETVALALNIVPFAGIAFLWFVGVLRDRLGQHEDRFFATVFFGSGLLFLAMLFVAAATVGGIIIAFDARPAELVNSATFHFARAVSYGLINIYILKIASVFVITTSTVTIYTALAPSWIAICGYGVAFFMLFGSYYLDWSFVVFPFWVLLLSVYILIDNLRRT